MWLGLVALCVLGAEINSQVSLPGVTVNLRRLTRMISL